MELSLFPVGINIFVIQDGKLLLGKRLGSAGTGMWGLPGGHLEAGESMLVAAARELKEETSLTAQEFVFLNLANNNGEGRHYLQVGFLAKEVTGTVQLMEPEHCSEWQWFALNSLPKEIFFGHAKQIELFLKNASFGDNTQ